MDTIPLVDEQIKDGERLLNRLCHEGVPVRAACWVKPTEEDRWSLYIATPLVDEKGAVGAYREVYRHLRSLGSLSVTDSDIKLISEKHPITKDALDIIQRYPGRGPVGSRRPSLGGIPVEEVYAYPPVEPLVKHFDEIKRKFPSAEIVTITILGGRNVLGDQAGNAFVRLIPLMGKVNAAQFEGKPPETLLFMGPKASSAEPLGMLVFVYRPEGWNTLYRNETNTWEKVVLANSCRPLYESADFSPLAAMKVREEAAEQRLCIPVSYVYRREERPESRRWHMNSRMIAPAPSLQRPGLLQIPEDTDRQVTLIFAVPCDARGAIPAEVKEEYEDWADETFKQLHPSEELA